MSKDQKDTRQNLLDTAMCLITQNSYNAVSVDDICKYADVKKGSFYHFFPSKHALAEAAFMTHWAESKRLLDEIFSPTLHPLERINRYCDKKYTMQKETLDKYGKVCGCAFATLAAEMSTQDDNFRQLTQQIFNNYIMYLENTLRDAAELKLIPKSSVKQLANEINAYTLGVLLSAKMQNNIETIKRDLKPGIYRILGIKEPKQATTQPLTALN